MVWRLILVFATTTFPVTVSSVCWMICIFFNYNVTETAWSTHPTLFADMLIYVNTHRFPLSFRSVGMNILCVCVCVAAQRNSMCIFTGVYDSYLRLRYSLHFSHPKARGQHGEREMHRRREIDLTRRWHKSEEATACVSANYSNAAAVGQVASARCPLKSPFGPVHCWQQLQL